MAAAAKSRAVGRCRVSYRERSLITNRCASLLSGPCDPSVATRKRASRARAEVNLDHAAVDGQARYSELDLVVISILTAGCDSLFSLRTISMKVARFFLR